MKNFNIPEETKTSLRNVVKKALEDKSFKEQLINNPREAISTLEPNSGISQEEREIVVVDQTDLSKIHINISNLSFALLGGELEDIELTEEELEMVAGGGSCLVWSCNKGYN